MIIMLNSWILKCVFMFIHICPLKGLQYSSDKKSYENALHECRSKGARLVKIDTDSKYEDVKSFIQQIEEEEHVWIDLRSEGDEYDVYRHSDGQEATFFVWDASIGEPNNQKTDRCVLLDGGILSYRTWECDKELHYICEPVALQYSTDKKSYDLALQECQSKGATLVKIDSFSKYHSVLGFMQPREGVEDVWIDLRSEGNEYNVYRHSDGQVATFFVWDASIGEPNSQKTDRCIRLHVENYGYRTWTCDSEFHYICETWDATTVSTQELVTPTKGPLSNNNITENCEVCECNIYYKSIKDPVVLEAVKGRIEEIKLTLSLNKSELSKQVRRKISAPDKRISSTLLGCVGILFIVFTFGVIVIPDTVKLVRYLKERTRTLSQAA